MNGERLAKFEINVCADNLNWGYGKTVKIIAATRADAIDRAINLGWGGRRADVKVAVLSVKDIDPRECPCATPTESETP